MRWARSRSAIAVTVALATVLSIAATAVGGTARPELPEPLVAAAPSALPTPPGTTERVSVGADGRQGNAASGGVSSLIAGANSDQAISADGRWVAFASTATNLIPGEPHPVGGIFLRDRGSGTTVAVPWVGGGPFPSGVTAAEPAISSDGAVVAFTVIVDGSAPRTFSVPTAPYVLVWDRQTNVTEVVSVDANGRPTPGFQPSISADGRYVAYTRWAVDNTPPSLSNLTTDGFPSRGQWYVYGPSAPCNPHSATISVTATDADGEVRGVTLFYQPQGSGVLSKAMTRTTGTTWQATIDIADAWSTGQITYWVQAVDDSGNTSSPLNNASNYLLNKGDCIL